MEIDTSPGFPGQGGGKRASRQERKAQRSYND